MDEDTAAQIEALRHERAAHLRRQGLLKERAATQGSGAPPELTMEIADIDTKISTIDGTIGKLLGASLVTERRQALQEATDPIARIWSYLFGFEDDVRRQLAALFQAQAQRAETDDAQRQVRQQTLDTRQWRRDLFLIGIFLVVLAIAWKVWGF